jgi:hypothetical protein
VNNKDKEQQQEKVMSILVARTNLSTDALDEIIPQIADIFNKPYESVSGDQIKKPTDYRELEQATMVAAELHNLAENWSSSAERAGLTTTEVCHGMTARVLSLLQNGNEEMPGFQMMPNQEQLETMTFHDLGDVRTWPNQQLLPAATYASYASHYEAVRRKLSISAKDLFD